MRKTGKVVESKIDLELWTWVLVSSLLLIWKMILWATRYCSRSMTLGTSDPHNNPAMSILYPASLTWRLRFRKFKYFTGLWFSSVKWRYLNYIDSNVPYDDPFVFSSYVLTLSFFSWGFTFYVVVLFFPSLLPPNWYFSNFMFGI